MVWLAATLSSPALELSPTLREKTRQALDAVWRNGPTAGDTMFLLREAGGRGEEDGRESGHPKRLREHHRQPTMMAMRWSGLEP